MRSGKRQKGRRAVLSAARIDHNRGENCRISLNYWLRDIFFAKTETYVAEGAVTSEPFSGVDFTVIQGKNREIRRFGASLVPMRCCKFRVSLAFLVEFPMQSNREFFERSRES
jgi:hypothetical protein